MKAAAKRVLFALAPRMMTAIMSSRARAQSQRLLKQWGVSGINRRLLDEVGNIVLSGPFKGLKLTPATWNEHIGPYLLGTYEMELHPWWDFVLQQQYDLIIDVGAKFGYYAVGLALKFPAAEIVAFDTDWWARNVMREMVRANGVSNVSIRGFCSPEWLKRHIRARTFIISDCEGFEGRLFSAMNQRQLAPTTMLIELHEELAPGVTAQIESHFAETHSSSKIGSRSPSLPADIRIASLTKEEIYRASNEIRPYQEWLFLRPL